jgi:hypothetical protein
MRYAILIGSCPRVQQTAGGFSEGAIVFIATCLSTAVGALLRMLLLLRNKRQCGKILQLLERSRAVEKN